MVNTKTEVKIKLKNWIKEKNDYFTTKEAIKSLQTSNKSKLRLSPFRISKYISATNKAMYDSIKKKWKPKNIITPKKLLKTLKN